MTTGAWTETNVTDLATGQVTEKGNSRYVRVPPGWRIGARCRILLLPDTTPAPGVPPAGQDAPKELQA